MNYLKHDSHVTHKSVAKNALMPLGMYIDKGLAIPMLYRFLFIDLVFYRFPNGKTSSK